MVNVREYLDRLFARTFHVEKLPHLLMEALGCLNSTAKQNLECVHCHPLPNLHVVTDLGLTKAYHHVRYGKFLTLANLDRGEYLDNADGVGLIGSMLKSKSGLPYAISIPRPCIAKLYPVELI